MAPVRILCVCTANQCRSPMAAALLMQRLLDAGIAADVSSVGLLEGGAPASPEAAAAMAELDLDLGAHRSRRMEADEVRDADLVLAMTREHAREVLTLDPTPNDRVYSHSSGSHWPPRPARGALSGSRPGSQASRAHASSRSCSVLTRPTTSPI